MIDTVEFSNFIGGFQFALLSQSLLSVAISKPSLLVVIMHISVILGIMNIFAQNISYETKKPTIEVESDECEVDEVHENVVADVTEGTVEAEAETEVSEGSVEAEVSESTEDTKDTEVPGTVETVEAEVPGTVETVEAEAPKPQDNINLD
jgi:hypothetical protein